MADPTPRPGPPGTLPDDLGEVLDLVTADPYELPTLIGVVPRPGLRSLLHVTTLPGPDPVENLVGIRNRFDWTAVLLCAPGRARHLDETGRAEAVRVVAVVGIDGSWRAVTVRRDGTILAADGAAGAPSAPLGHVGDFLRRIMGLATPPPASGTQILGATAWLQALHVLVTEAPGDEPPPWQELAMLHPLFHDGHLVEAMGGWRDELLVAAGNASARLHDWETIMAELAGNGAGALADDHLDADWFDAGSFSRWFLAPRPPLWHLLEAVRLAAVAAWGNVGATALEIRLRATLEAWRLGPHLVGTPVGVSG